MKTFRFIPFLMVMALAALTLTACEKDDTDFSSIINSSSSTDGNDTDSSGTSDTDDSDGSSASSDSSNTSGNISYAVNIEYSGTSATVTVADDVAPYLTVSKSGAKVSIVQSGSLPNEVTYTLSGSSSNGSFYMDGELKATVVLNGLSLTNSSGPAINIENGKRIEVVLADGATNTLTDSTSGDHKGAFMVKGHTEFSGSGTLNMAGKMKHAFWGDEYVVFKKSLGSINVTSAVGDGFNVNQYIEMNGGTISIKGVGDEGIQTNIEDGSESYDDGSFFMNGGQLTIVTTDGKGIKADGDIEINDGELNITASGSEGMESGSITTINGGKTTVQSYDDAINSQSHIYLTGGEVYAKSNNNDGIDANGNIYMQGGLVVAIGGKAPECGMDSNEESNYTVYFTGGNLFAVGGDNSIPSNSNSTQGYITASGSVSANTTVTISKDSSTLATFNIPFSSNSNANSIIATAAGMTAGNTYTLKVGSSSTSATAVQYGNGNSQAGQPGGIANQTPDNTSPSAEASIDTTETEDVEPEFENEGGTDKESTSPSIFTGGNENFNMEAQNWNN